MTKFDLLALKAAAWKYIHKHQIGGWWERTFAEPIKAALLKTKAERVEVPDLGPVYLRRDKDTTGLDSTRVSEDLSHLVNSKQINGGDLRRLYEAGVLTIGNVQGAADYCAKKMEKPVEGYTIKIPAARTTPELRFPQKPKLEAVYKRLLPLLDWDVKLAHLNKGATQAKIKKALAK